jgi:biopolymer transport protein ExbB
MMIPLLISALVALTLIFERLYYFKKVYYLSNADYLSLKSEVEGKNFKRVADVTTAQDKPLSSIFATGATSFDLSEAELEKVLTRKAQTWIPLLEKRLEVLDTIITAAPLMGLLGTITGMMASFQVLSTNGVNEPNAITGGVAEALIATATGLVVALVSLIFYNYFNSKVRQTLDHMEAVGNLFLSQKTDSTRKS